VAKGLNAGDHHLPCGGSIGLVFHYISNNSRRLEAHSSEKPSVASDVFNRHGSPYVEGNGVERGGRILVPYRLIVDFSNIGLGNGTMSAKGEWW
jgi:hypothetical protein